MLKYAAILALVALACQPSAVAALTAEDQALFDKLAAKVDAEKRQRTVRSAGQSSISTDAKGNVNVNTKTNGDLVVNRREESVIRISNMVSDIEANANSIVKMQNNAALYVSAQQFMSTMAADTMKATGDIKLTQAKSDLALAKVLEDVKGISEGVDKKLKEAQDKVDKSITKLTSDAAAATKKAQEAAAAAAKKAADEATKSAASIKKMVEDAMKPLKAVSDNYSKDSLYFVKERYQLKKWHVPVAGKGVGRVFYKVDFNPGSPGNFNIDRRELFAACTGLSNDLKARDGKDRALKPVCNNPSHTDSKCVKLANSYFSHYGGTGYYAVNNAGYGLPLHFSAGSIFYSPSNQWGGQRMLWNRGRANHHDWVQPNLDSTRKGFSTVCTSSNGNYKLKPV